MTTNTQPRKRFETLDALRGVAALFIACFHFPAIYFGTNLAPLRHAYVMTTFFFALSGFIIMAAYGHKLNDTSSFKSFSITRLSRLIPLHLVTSALIVAVPFVAYFVGNIVSHLIVGHGIGGLPSFPIDSKAYAIQLFMLQGFGLIPHLVFNFPSWSMGAIFLCSIGLAAICTYARDFKVPLFALLISIGFYVLMTKAPSYAGSSHDYGIYRAIMSYFTGSMVYVIWQRWTPGEAVLKWASLIQSISVVLLIWYMSVVGVNTPNSMWSPLFMAFVIWAFSMDSGDYAKFFQKPVFKWLSDRSYSLFMSHALLLFIGNLAEKWISRLDLEPFVGHVVGTASLLLYLALVLVISNWTFKHVEVRFSGRIARA